MNHKRVHFNEVITFIETKVQNIPVVFTTDRLDKTTVPHNFNVYDVSLNEADFEYDFIGKNLNEKVYASVISVQPLKLDDNEVYKIKKSDLKIGKSQDFASIVEFMNKYA